MYTGLRGQTYSTNPVYSEDSKANARAFLGHPPKRKRWWDWAERSIPKSARQFYDGLNELEVDLDAYEKDSSYDTDCATETSGTDGDLSESSSDLIDLTKADTDSEDCDMRLTRSQSKGLKKRRISTSSDEEEDDSSSWEELYTGGTRSRPHQSKLSPESGHKRQPKKRKTDTTALPSNDIKRSQTKLAFIELPSDELVDLTTTSPIESPITATDTRLSTAHQSPKQPYEAGLGASTTGKTIKNALKSQRKQLSELVAQAKVCDNQLQKMASEIDLAEDHVSFQKQQLDKERESIQRTFDENNKSVIEELRREIQTKNDLIKDLKHELADADKSTTEVIALRKVINELKLSSETQNAATRMILSFLDKASPVLMIPADIRDAMDKVRGLMDTGRAGSSG
ncbi:hypothetical protein ABW21_db0200836 [Orbilia brochopaga]|nr:hypothetical protein ABW21_db0200836 [Drechslerella brochopaga]